MNEYSRDALYHYGTIGMKWGIRRFQPYPSDYHGDGKFVGKQQKQNFKVLKKAVKGPLFRSGGGYKGIRETNLARTYLNSKEYQDRRDAYEEAFDKREKANRKFLDAESKLDDLRLAFDDPATRTKAQQRAIDLADKKALELYKKWEDTKIDTGNASMALRESADNYAKEVLGDYGDKKVSGLNVPGAKQEMRVLLREALERTFMDDSHDRTIYNKENGKKVCDTSIDYYGTLSTEEKNKGLELQKNAIKNYSKIQQRIVKQNKEEMWKWYQQQNEAVGREEPSLTKGEFFKSLRLRYMGVDPKEPDALDVSINVKDKGDFWYPQFLGKVNIKTGKSILRDDGSDYWDPHF